MSSLMLASVYKADSAEVGDGGKAVRSMYV